MECKPLFINKTMEKVKILNMGVYLDVVKFIANFKGLSIDCELALQNHFINIDERTLGSILFLECNQKIRTNLSKYQNLGGYLLKMFETNYNINGDSSILLRIAIEFDIPPSVLNRLILYEKYTNNVSKTQIIEMLKNPHKIPDDYFIPNIMRNLFSDNQEGPIVDINRRCVGEEYEMKLKEIAENVGMKYFDECDLRRTGFDKTPDLKLVLPCLYNGAVINWIESKAVFGDVKIHRRYLQQQLVSYNNRFGSGIVIYWFGYVEEILNLKENFDGLIILSDFPDKKNLEFLKL